MGWLFSCDKTLDKERLVEKLMTRGFSDGYKLLEYKVVENNLWFLYSRPDQTKTIGLYLLQSGGNDEGWGYKDLSEDDGPNELNCPIEFIEKVDPPQCEYARDWRENVIQAHAKKKALKKAFRPDALFYLWEKEYRVIEKQKGTSTWVVMETSTEKMFRLSKQSLQYVIFPPEKEEAVIENLDLFA